MTAVQSPNIWYPDGNIVLQCQNTLFCVHLDILARNCHVFEDMTRISHPTCEAYEGRSIISLQDSPGDVTHFLKALYDASYFRTCSFVRIPTVVAILRLSTKYEATTLRCRAIDILNSAYPSNPLSLTNIAGNRLFPPLDDEFTQILTAAILYDVRSILPGLLYAAAKRPLAQVMLEIQALPLHRSIIDDICTRFVVGRDKLRDAEVKHVLKFLSPSIMRPGCQNRNSDTVRLQLHAPRALFKIADAQPYQDWCRTEPSSVGRSVGLCDPCCAAIEREIWVGLEAVWNELPGIFGMPGWETLRKEDRWED